MKRRHDSRRAASERGSAATTLVIALPVMIGIMGFAIDLSYAFARKTELQQIADVYALVTARELNGTKAGVINAQAKATEPAIAPSFGFNRLGIVWNPAALLLAASPSAPDSDWKDATSIGSDAAATGLVYAKIDTTRLAGFTGDPGEVQTFFLKILGAADVLNLRASAVAGPAALAVTPLAVCAMDPSTPTGTRINTPAASERIEYGFRTGVSYNLLDLSPSSTTPQAYVVNPLDPGAGSSNPLHFSAAYVKQFFCTGTAALPLLGKGSTVHVTPLAGLPVHDWLNSRFNSYSGSDACNPVTAPPDSDIREFIGGYANWYMSTSPYPSASTSTNRNATTSPARASVADLTPADTSSVTPSVTSFGPLWTYARPVKTSGGEFSVTEWDKLYTYGGVAVPNTTTARYVSSGYPYQSTRHKLTQAGGVRDRRVLNVPLLDCSAGVPTSPASVLGTARFFMTAKATATPAVIPGEFAGMLSTNSPVTAVALYK